MTYDPSTSPSVLLRVLVVDARVSVNESLVTLLSESEGLAVFGCAQEPVKVLALVQTVHPDVVILDLQMEGPIGLKTLKQIKSLPHAPVMILLSHYDMPPIRQAAIAAGADHFLIKTTECGRLEEVLHDLQMESVARPPIDRAAQIGSTGASG
jgi:DNA-binding NarL/FixJ family response regulator